ncbi:hypothetical protein BDW74DRAFT_183013 [Aspergillus multicolor]|uniref:uncharacterized protein n=1 Tax=Aspergillus multicolor TaxID=41759 RepID=UPI003CCE4E6F
MSASAAETLTAVKAAASQTAELKAEADDITADEVHNQVYRFTRGLQTQCATLARGVRWEQGPALSEEDQQQLAAATDGFLEAETQLLSVLVEKAETIRMSDNAYAVPLVAIMRTLRGAIHDVFRTVVQSVPTCDDSVRKSYEDLAAELKKFGTLIPVGLLSRPAG